MTQRLSQQIRETQDTNQSQGTNQSLEDLRIPAEAGIRNSPASSEIAANLSKTLDWSQSLRVAVAQIKAYATRIDDNCKKVISTIEEAELKQVNLLVFPELTIPGYLAHDNLNNPEFVKKNVAALREIALSTTGKNVAVIVGFVDMEDRNSSGQKNIYYNSAALIKDGKIVDVIDKTLLPDYDIFWEKRYFESAKSRNVIEVDGHKIGLQICEDLWDKDYNVKVTEELKKQGAEIIVNISASPFQAGKYEMRQKLVTDAARNYDLPFIYANLVGAQDGYEGEVVFDGRSMIASHEGKLLSHAQSFDEDLLITDIHSAKEIPLPEWESTEEIHHALVLGIKDYCLRNGFKKVYIGLSGGIDSALTAALAVEALGPENVIGVTMPSHITSEETKSDALRQAENMGIVCHTRPITRPYNAWLVDAQEAHEKVESLTRQNVQARIRGQILMEYTNQDRAAMLVTTGNKTEMAMGYMTLYGDMCGGLAALADVNKLMVYQLSEYINEKANREIIPLSVIQRTPTAELEKDQTDKANLPADYPVLAPLVDSLIEGTKSKAELIELYGQEVVEKTARVIAINEHKRRQAPPGIRVTGKSFGAGRRYPVDNKHY